MVTYRRVLLLVGTLAALGLPDRAARSEEDAADARWQPLQVEVLAQLHALADQCARKQLFGVRADLYIDILSLSPDDAVARRRLKYTRDRAGEWVRKARWHRPRNLGRGAAEIAAARRDLGTALAPRLETSIDASRAAGRHDDAADAVTAALAVDPESETFRNWNGEARDGEAGRPGEPSKWILQATLRARKRRPLLAETARNAVESMPPAEDGKPSANDGIGDVEWTARLQGRRVRVVGTPPRAELEQTLRYAEAAWPLFEAAFGTPAATYDSGDRYARGLTIYTMESREAGTAFLSQWPGITEREVAFRAPLVTTWIKGRPAVICKTSDRVMRLEGAPKMVLHGMTHGVLGLQSRRAWAKEGLSLYLTWLITGTRQIYTVRDVESRYGDGERPLPEYLKNLSDSDADWLALGLGLAQSVDKPDLHLLAGKDMNDLTKADALYAYCLCAYLLEGRPDECLAFFRRIATDRGTDIGAASAEILGFGPEVLEARLVRWLTESTGG